MGNVNISVTFDTAEWDDVREGSEVTSGIIELDNNYAVVLDGTVILQIEQRDDGWAVVDSVDTDVDIGVGSESDIDRVALFALHLLSVSKEPQEYYSETKDILEIDEKFQENEFTGIVDFSDGTVQGDHYVGYIDGDRYSITVDNSDSLVCGAESFSRVENDVGIYKIFALDNVFESISLFELQESHSVADDASNKDTSVEEDRETTDESTEESVAFDSGDDPAVNDANTVDSTDSTDSTASIANESAADGDGEVGDEQVLDTADEQVSKLRAQQKEDDVDSNSDVSNSDVSSINERVVNDDVVDEQNANGVYTEDADVAQTVPDMDEVLDELDQLQTDINQLAGQMQKIDRLETQLQKMDQLEAKMQKIDTIEQRMQNEFSSKLDDLIDLGLESSDMSQSELSDSEDDETFEGITEAEAIQSTNVQFRFNHSSNMNMMDIESLGGSALKTALDKMSVIPKSSKSDELVNGVEYETFINSSLEYTFSSWVVKYLYLVLQEDDMPHIPSVLRLVPRLDQAEFMQDGPFDIVFYERDGGTPRSVVKTFTDDFVSIEDIKDVLGDGLDFATDLEEEITVFILTDVSFEPTVRAELDKITEDKSLLWGQKKDSLVLPDSEEDEGEIQVCLVETHKDSFNLVYPD